jgi:ribosomal protein S12 methylthiotransferase
VGNKSKISVVTMGCSKNLVDSEMLLGQLKLNRTHIAQDVGDADTVVINTCGFIEAAKQESVDAILEAVERKNKGELKKIVVMGCMAERYKRELMQEIPQIDVIFGTNNIQEVVENLGADYKKELLGERVITTPSHYAYLKISEGCDRPCSFCAIPLMRGRHRSKPLDEVVAEARRLASQGVKELIIIAQESTFYGLDLYGERRLDTLLTSLCEIPEIEWIRLMYAYPAQFPVSLLKVYRDQPKICRYLDIPVQHISDTVLKSMRRGLTGKTVRTLLVTIRNEVPDIALRTTLIVGYPNETEKDFKMLCDFVEQTRFHRLGVFTYSQEDGTYAYSLGDPVPDEVKQKRRDILMELQKGISEERNESLVGSRLNIVIDSKEHDGYIGRTEWDAPEIDQEVFVEAQDGLAVGRFYNVHIKGSTEYDLVGDVSTIDAPPQY